MNSVQFSALFTSIEEMAETSGFDIDFCQLETGQPIIKTWTTILPSVFSSKFYFSKSYHQRGMAPAGYLTFGIPQQNSIFRWMGKEINSNNIFNFNARSGFDIKSEGQFSAKTIHVKADRVYDIANLNGISLSGMGETEYSVPRFVNPKKLHQLQGAIHQAEELVSMLGILPQAEINIETAEDAIYRKLVDCLDFSQKNDLLSYSNRFIIMRRAMDYIRSNCREIITITDVCCACSTTSRTLERVFKEEFGVTPNSYIKMVKLSGVRRDLCQKTSQKSIKDIAIYWGFWHMSQFAQDYKNYYGELPSQTRQLRSYPFLAEH